MKLLIVGGVAGGASAAARARRLNEDAEIILFERGEYISFANCGLPYHISKTIPERESLLVMTPQKFKGRANIDIRVKQEVININRKEKTIKVKNLETGKNYTESYDKLILSPGSTPLIPPITGADDPDVDVLWTIPDMDKIIKKVDSGIKNAVVVGGGFIGLEVVENLIERGVNTTLVEMFPQVLPPFDKEMAQPLKEILELHGVQLNLNNAVSKVEKNSNVFKLTLKDNSVIETEMVIFSAGVRPNSKLAKDAELEINERGGIIVNKLMQTSDKDIFAVGDAVQVDDPILNVPTMIPLAGPANKQGRIAADNAFGGNSEYKGTIGTSVCKLFELTAASTGINEKRLAKEGVKYNKFYITPNSNASYYPGSSLLYTKIIHDEKGKILGAQIVGQKGVDKRIDLLATAIKHNLTFSDLEELELAYAPPYGSAKDPINFVGYVGNNILNKNSEIVNSDKIPQNAFLLDIRDPDEVLCGTIPKAVNIPLGQLRKRVNELPKDKEIVVFCKVGARGYLGELILRSNGFNVKNLSGGYEIWKLFNPADNNCEVKLGIEKELEKENKENEEEILNMDNIKISAKLNACGLQCPGPIIKVKENIEKLNNGEILEISVNDMGFMKDIPAWCQSTGNTLLDVKNENGNIEALIQKGLSKGIKVTETTNVNGEKSTTIVMFSNDLDKALASMIIASGFASLGHKVSIFFTFWGINVLRKDNPPSLKKDLLSRMFGFMMPRGPKKLALSKMHMMGMGTGMMKHVMKMKNIDSLPVLMEQAQSMGVKFLVCEMAMNMMGIQEEELIDNVDRVGVANFAVLSEKSTSTLFI
jgi:NADPH-dependent 2,4-dienoyl-CoA reductase/sulfur reductase-like enzyme/peroxiredoxin family protein/TusA-related sulfurtransferase/rhodanese-related sulfurtransferase